MFMCTCRYNMHAMHMCSGLLVWRSGVHSLCDSGWDEVGGTEQEEVTRDKEGATGD